MTTEEKVLNYLNHPHHNKNGIIRKIVAHFGWFDEYHKIYNWTRGTSDAPDQVDKIWNYILLNKF
jgi:hypothetical protein